MSRPWYHSWSIAAWLFGVLAATTAWLTISEPMAARAAAIAVMCLTLWLTEIVPPFAPTLLLVAAVPVLLTPFGPEHRLGPVLGWLADPVLALFFSGFTIGAAVSRHGLDQVIAAHALIWSRGSATRLVLLTMLVTAGLSLWMSNIAAMALMLAALQPILKRSSAAVQRAALVAIAMAANVGGMGTPIGSGPNALAMGAAGPGITFLRWMEIGIPVMIGALMLTWILVRLLLLRRDEPLMGEVMEPPPITPSGWIVLGLVGLTIIAWMSEPWHHIPSPTIAMVLAALFFVSRLLTADDFLHLDWSTIALIGGGIALGRLLEHTGIIVWLGQALGGHALSPMLTTLALAFVAALLSALMSNTATATMLIPLASALDPAPPTLSVVIALACSFGVPFVISTPQNAMAVGAGARPRDLLRVGLPMMLIGCVVLVLMQPLIALVFAP